MTTASVDVAVIGGGLGGLAAALTAARGGASVALFEAKDTVGGFATCFYRKGFRFDASLHMLDAVEPGGGNRPIWEALGLHDRVETRTPQWMRREIWPDHVIDVPHGLDAYVDALTVAFPHEATGFRSFARRARKVQAAYIADRDGRLDGRDGEAMDSAIAELLDCTAEEYLRTILRDPRAVTVAAALSCYLGIGPDELGAIPFLSMIGGYHGDSGSYPVGSSRAVTDALLEQLLELGVEVRCGCAVTGIDASRGAVTGVRLVNGEQHGARMVVSNAPPLRTLGSFLPDGTVPPRLLRRLRAMTLGTSALKVWLGVRAGPGSADVAYETFLRRDYSTSFAPMSLNDLGVVAAHKLDPDCAPEGHEVYSLTTGLHADVDNPSPDQHRVLVDRMLAQVESCMLPGLRDRIVVQSVATPATFRAFTGNLGGTIHGFRSTPKQSGPRRLGIRTPVRGLYQVGGWTYAGSGFLPALTSGMIAGRHLLREGR